MEDEQVKPADEGRLERKVMAPLPKLLGDGGACFFCGQKLLGQCKSHYDSLTCVQRPLEEEDEA